jgi:hypothetical protein
MVGVAGPETNDQVPVPNGDGTADKVPVVVPVQTDWLLPALAVAAGLLNETKTVSALVAAHVPVVLMAHRKR